MNTLRHPLVQAIGHPLRKTEARRDGIEIDDRSSGHQPTTPVP